jgi:hypothetical protein
LREELVGALCEAGAIDVVMSPRSIGSLVRLSQRLTTARLFRPKDGGASGSFDAQARAALPWQAR